MCMGQPSMSPLVLHIDRDDVWKWEKKMLAFAGLFLCLGLFPVDSLVSLLIVSPLFLLLALTIAFKSRSCRRSEWIDATLYVDQDGITLNSRGDKKSWSWAQVHCVSQASRRLVFSDGTSLVLGIPGLKLLGRKDIEAMKRFHLERSSKRVDYAALESYCVRVKFWKSCVANGAFLIAIVLMLITRSLMAVVSADVFEVILWSSMLTVYPLLIFLVLFSTHRLQKSLERQELPDILEENNSV